MSKEDYKPPAGTALSWGNGEETVHQVGSVPPIHPQHPTEIPKGQETAGQIPPSPSCCRPVPYRAQAASSSLGPPVLLGWANSKGLKLSLPPSCPVAAVCLPWDCCRAESCRSFYDASLREQLHQPQRWGETANGQRGIKLPTLPGAPVEAGSHRNDSTGHKNNTVLGR